jgi:CheY-like chemotaxis protein
MDVRMPRLDGIEATRRLRNLPETPPVLILTTFDEDELLWGRSRPARAGSCSRTPPPKSSSPG